MAFFQYRIFNLGLKICDVSILSLSFLRVRQMYNTAILCADFIKLFP